MSVRRFVATTLLATSALLPNVGGPAHAETAPITAPAPVPVQLDQTVRFDGTVRAVAYLGDRIYVGGDFAHAITPDRRWVGRTRLAAIDARTGQLLDWAPTADARVRALTASDRGVFVGGDFRTVNGEKRDALAQLDPVTGALTPFRHNVYGHPHTLAVTGTRLYVGGTLTTVDNHTVGRVAAFDLTTGALDLAWRPRADNYVDAVVASGDRVYLGGAFRKINGADTKHLAMLDLTGTVQPFPAISEYDVASLSLFTTTLYAAVAGRGGRAIAIDTVTGAVKWTVTTDGDVRSVVRLRDTVYVGGHFDRVCASENVGDKGACLDGSQPRVKMAAVDATGRLLPWVADANGVVGVESLAASGVLGRIAAGGSFTQINGVPQERFLQFAGR